YGWREKRRRRAADRKGLQAALHSAKRLPARCAAARHGPLTASEPGALPLEKAAASHSFPSALARRRTKQAPAWSPQVTLVQERRRQPEASAREPAAFLEQR